MARLSEKTRAFLDGVCHASNFAWFTAELVENEFDMDLKLVFISSEGQQVCAQFDLARCLFLSPNN